MKRFISIILTVLLAVSMATPVFAAEATKAKFNLSALQKELQAMKSEYSSDPNLYKVYDSRIIAITNHLIALNKDIAAKNPPAKTKSLRETLEMADNLISPPLHTNIRQSAGSPNYGVYVKPGAPKKKDFKDLQATSNLVVKMQRELDKAMVYYKFKKEYNTPSVNVTEHYQKGMDWYELRENLNPQIGGWGVAESGNLVQGDGVTPTNINVIISGDSYKIHINGWRRTKTDGSGMSILKQTRIIFNYFWKDAGDAAFLWYDTMMTRGNADTDDFGISGKDLGNGRYRLTHNKSGISMIYAQENGHDSFYVE